MSKQRISTSHLLLLLIGFISITVAVIGAYSKPATSYELSIYSQTPIIFWIGIIISLTVSVIVTFGSRNSQVRLTALGLGDLSMIVVVLLPLIRNYHFTGEADSLSHLGIALDINAGTISALGILYPLSHTLSVIIHDVTKIEIRRAIVLLVAVFVVIFILFVPLTARLFSNAKWTISVATFSSLLLLPVNHFTGHMHPHTTSYAMFFIPLLIYLFVLLMDIYDGRYVVLILVSMMSIILLHPQQAANIIILFSTVAALQLLINSLPYWKKSVTKGNQIYPYMALMLAIFWLWTEGLEKIAGNLRRPIANFLARSRREPGGNVRSSVPSLEAAGGSPEEIFVKLFLIGFLFCIFASILMAASLTEVFKRKSDRIYRDGKQIAFSSSSSNFIIVYFTFGFIAIIGLFLVYVLADQSRQYFRHHSFMMVIVTIIGSLSLGQLLKIGSKHLPERELITGVCVLFVIILLLSVPIVHVSPYIYQESQHVPESQIQGYETAFEHQNENIPFSYIRSNSGRYYDAIVGERGTASFNKAEPVNPPSHFSEQGSLRVHYDEQTYLAVTSRDRIRDHELHRGVRYTLEDYEQFDEETGIDRIQDNGGFTLYRINPTQDYTAGQKG